MEAVPEPAVEDVRKVAIAKLKRAASLPRMKDGRRPAMHAEGVSEGEKSGVSTPLPLQPDDLTAPDTVLAQTEVELFPQSIQKSASPNPRYGPTPPPNDSAPEETPKASSHKRRSRSRSRSRGSKDFRKQKNQAMITPQSQSPRSEESSQDEESVPVGHTLPPPMVPSPIHFFPQQQPMHPNNPLFQNFIPNAPPSLEALQRHIMAGSGLQRSSSAREQAMNKLLGRQDQVSNNQGGPPSAFPGAKLVRSNTSTGFERSTRHVARNELFRKLSNRRAAGNGGATTEGEQTTSGGEEFTSTSKKPLKRPPGNTVIDDRDPPHLSPSPGPMRSLTPKTHLTPLMAHSTIHDRHPSPSPSHASSQTPSVRRQSLERNRDSAFAKLTGENQFELEQHRLLPVQQPRLVVEENDEPYPTEVVRPVPSRYDGNHRSYTPTLSRASPKSEITTQSPQPTSAGNPVLTLAAAVAALEPQDGYPMKTRRPSGANSPFSMVDEQVVYGDDSRSRRAPTDNVISWVELEEPRIPVEEDADSKEEAHPDTPPPAMSLTVRVSPNLRSPSTPPKEDSLIYGPRTPSDFPASSIESNNTLFTHSTTGTGNEADESSSSESMLHLIPFVESGPRNDAVRTELSDWENAPNRKDVNSKSSRDEVLSTGSGKFDTLKKVITGKLSRTPSLAGSIGRRSRSNSVVNRRDAEAILNRESASSFASGRQDNRSERHSHQAQLSATESLLSLGSPLPPSGGVSHMPVASSNNTKYLDSKLYPFPGIVTLQKESERKRARGMSISTPDVTLPLASEMSPGFVASGPDRDRKLSTQISDSRLQLRYKQEPPRSASTTPKTAPAVNGVDYFSTSRQKNMPQTPPSKPTGLPMDRQGVKHWLKKFVPKPSEPRRKASFSDIKVNQKQDEWEEAVFPGYSRYQASRSPEPASSNALNALSALTADGYESISDSKSSQRTPERSPIVSSHPSLQGLASAEISTSDQSPISTPQSFLRPEPAGASDKLGTSPFLSQPHTGTSSPGNYDTLSSKSPLPYSSQSLPSRVPARATNLIRRFHYLLSTEASPTLMEPSRKLIASSPVLQISGTDTVKRRILMLFNDLLILAKPLTAESMKKDSRPSAFLDDPVMVKSVLLLKEVVLSSRRRDHKDPFGLRGNSTIQNFVREFKREPDYAISSLMQGRDEPETLAFILFNSHELDRAQLSTYLSRKSSRQILRSYIDQFGFTGVRIDQALRVFWSSVGSTISQSTADNLLSGFATRWFDANSQLVSFDRDLAMRIVGAIMQLNQALHPSQYGSDSANRTRHITAREFITAFRRYDPRYLVADDMLEHIYNAVERDKLSQPLRSSNASNLRISLKQPIPMRLVYKNETEPIIVKIPSPDSNFSIQLLGHGLLFNPPILHFHSSSEASFRVTGTALGTKTIIMSRIGSHAPFYSGLPISRTVAVEKAFMQNVFQITSPSITGASKTYLFSVDENHHHLPQQLQEQLSKVQDSSLQNGRVIVDEVQSASELLALKALRDTILNSNEPFSPLNGHHLHPMTKAAPRQWTAKTLTRACRQNSLLPSLLVKASQSRS